MTIQTAILPIVAVLLISTNRAWSQEPAAAQAIGCEGAISTNLADVTQEDLVAAYIQALRDSGVLGQGAAVPATLQALAGAMAENALAGAKKSREKGEEIPGQTTALILPGGGGLVKISISVVNTTLDAELRKVVADHEAGHREGNKVVAETFKTKGPYKERALAIQAVEADCTTMFHEAVGADSGGAGSKMTPEELIKKGKETAEKAVKKAEGNP